MTKTHFHNQDYHEFWTARALNVVNRDVRKKVFEGLLPSDIKSILEVGCNAGYNLEAISQIGNFDLAGIDSSEYAISQASKEIKDKLSLGDGQCLPFEDETFDLVLSCGYLCWIGFDDLAKAISELNRVCKKYILVIDYCFVGDLEPHGDLELMVCYKGAPLYIVRNYIERFKEFELAGHSEVLPQEFSVMPMSAWIFRKKNGH